MPRPHKARTRQLWRQRLRRFKNSRLTVAQFCKAENVSQASFYVWRKKLTDPDATNRSARLDSDPDSRRKKHFVPVTVIERGGNEASLQFSFPNGTSLSINSEDPRLLQTVIESVAALQLPQGDAGC